MEINGRTIDCSTYYCTPSMWAFAGISGAIITTVALNAIGFDTLGIAESVISFVAKDVAIGTVVLIGGVAIAVFKSA
jgi:hypothetical protein